MNPPLKYLTRFFIRPVLCCTAGTFLLLSTGVPGVAQTAAAGLEAEVAEEGAEVLTRGPVHEAFAETVTFKPTTGALVPKAAPAPVEELPPDQRPEGDNVTWIPGYWAWDDESSEFLWVSGIWRNLPPGRQWMPGYWSESGTEFSWVSGYWADSVAEEVEYLPEPPATIEAGPNVKCPSVDHSWMPGSWIWYQSSYRWRPGYWEVSQPEWVWVPSYYVWTPHGYVYVDGYYDYAVARRGMIFAPVRFRAGYYSRPGYYYRPYTVINLNLFTDHLFLRPRHRHYYFGDYYAHEYRRSGFYACHSYNSGGHGYDPLFAHARWNHRHDDRWERRVEENYAHFRDNRDDRPPHTLAEFQKYAARPDGKRRVDAGFVRPISKVVDDKDGVIKLKPVNEEERQKYVQRGREIRNFGDKRRKLAIDTVRTPDDNKPGKGKAGKGEAGKQEPVRVKIPRSPVAAQAAAEGSKEIIPPKRREFTLPDSKPGEKSDAGRRKDGKPAEIPDTQPGRKPKKGEPGEKPKADPKVDPRRVPKLEPKVTPPNPVPKVVPKETRKREPKREPVVPTPKPKVEPKRVPKFEPKGEPKREPKAQPGIEPRREPKIEPRVVPKVEPRVTPKLEPRVIPKAEPKRESESEDKGKGKSRQR